MFNKFNKIPIIFFATLFITSYSSVTFSKEKDYENFNWNSPNKWEGAMFDVPTWFAKDMRYTGKEIIRFHDGFYDEKSVGFWTYAFGLLVDQTKLPTTEELIDETHRYFVGLVRTLGDSSKPNYPKDKIIVKKTSELVAYNKNRYHTQNFVLNSFDSFGTGKPLKLNVKITTWLCSDKKRAIHYAISPHPMTHPIWKQLNKEIPALKCW